MMLLLSFFFFKQKTAYEMRISDWSSDVCSSDLLSAPECADRRPRAGGGVRARRVRATWPCRPIVQPRRGERQPRARAIDLHGRDGRDRGDPRAGDGPKLRDPR